mmetsp:Transcript_48846/g.104544  ORF Transcript_48846/g.104544 Transcript_48846/m.104544 type:complete len:269 (-) Transcript_48846:1015-1821(-)
MSRCFSQEASRLPASPPAPLSAPPTAPCNGWDWGVGAVCILTTRDEAWYVGALCCRTTRGEVWRSTEGERPPAEESPPNVSTCGSAAAAATALPPRGDVLRRERSTAERSAANFAGERGLAEALGGAISGARRPREARAGRGELRALLGCAALCVSRLPRAEWTVCTSASNRGKASSRWRLAERTRRRTEGEAHPCCVSSSGGGASNEESCCGGAGNAESSSLAAPTSTAGPGNSVSGPAKGAMLLDICCCAPWLVRFFRPIPSAMSW